MENYLSFSGEKDSVLNKRWIYKYDRFIPFRPHLKLENAHNKVFSPRNGPMVGQENDAYCRILAEALDYCEGEKVLPTSPTKRPCTDAISENLSPPWYPSNKENIFGSSAHTSKRSVVSSPDHILDMPGLRDDFYTNVLDWSPKNQIVVALDQKTFVWCVDTKECKKIEANFPHAETVFVSSLAWNESGDVLAIATSEGEILLWDAEQLKLIRTYVQSDKSQVGSVAWSDTGFCSGSSKGNIFLFDPRAPVCTYMLTGHSGDLCGLKYSPDKRYLASGGDDGEVVIWTTHGYKPLSVIFAHKACAKALAWCPWRQSMLASGGGSSDGFIRLWHVHTEEKIAEIFTNSQVCSLLWSEDYRELVSSHGTSTFENNDIIMWKNRGDKFETTGKLKLHRRRPLHLCLSPERTTLASVGADETLCLWKCFPLAGKSKRMLGSPSSQLLLNRSIR